MAITTTTRLGVTRWSGGNDRILRTQMDDSHAALEAKAAVFTAGNLSSRPAAGASNARGFYLATDQNVPQGILYYSDGSTWVALNNFADPGTANPGDTIGQGTSIAYARADHRHAMPAWGVVGEVATIGTSPVAGTVAKFARIDHSHILANGAVTAGKIAAGGVSATNQVADGIITAEKFAPGAVGGASISEDMRLRPGFIMMFGAASAPTGWLLCDGSSYPTSSYGGLFGVIGYTYGGSGANFNVPDLRGRVPLGTGTGTGLQARPLGQKGGSEAIALILTEIPGHVHSIVSHNHGGITGSGATDHNHPISFTSGQDSPDHSHLFDGTTAGFSNNHQHFIDFMSGNENVSHYHEPDNGGDYVVSGSGPSAGLSNPGTGFAYSNTTAYPNTVHQHRVSGWTDGAHVSHTHAFSGGTQGANQRHTHAIVGGTGISNSTSHAHPISSQALTTDSTGGQGGSSVKAHDNMTPFSVVNFIIKI